MRSLSVHLNRLKKVFKARGIPCKRHQTLEVAAAAFGYHNQNELTAASKAGDLDLPMAEPIGEAALPSGETIIVVRDPLANSAYAINQAFVEQVVAEERAELFGPTPYGHLLNLSRLLDDEILPLQASCLVAERCWDRVRWAIEEYTWRFDGLRRRSPHRRRT